MSAATVEVLLSKASLNASVEQVCLVSRLSVNGGVGVGGEHLCSLSLDSEDE